MKIEFNCQIVYKKFWSDIFECWTRQKGHFSQGIHNMTGKNTLNSQITE